MKKKIMILKCMECNRHNYTILKEKKNISDKLKIKKYCKFDNRHTVHEESKQK